MSQSQVYDLVICVFVFPLLAFLLAAVVALVETARDGLIRRSYGKPQRTYRRSKPVPTSERPEWWTSAKPYSLDELTSYGKPRKE